MLFLHSSYMKVGNNYIFRLPVVKKSLYFRKRLKTRDERTLIDFLIERSPTQPLQFYVSDKAENERQNATNEGKRRAEEGGGQASKKQRGMHKKRPLMHRLPKRLKLCKFVCAATEGELRAVEGNEGLGGRCDCYLDLLGLSLTGSSAHKGRVSTGPSKP